MTRLASISTLAAALMFTTSAVAQVSATPPAAQKSEPEKPAAKPKTKPHTVTKKLPAPAAEAKSTTPAPAATAPDDPNVDRVYGAYQRGQYKTAFDLATVRAQAGDPKAMTMLGELYANELGVRRDDAKAVEWYKRAADAGDRCRDHVAPIGDRRRAEDDYELGAEI